MLIIIYSSLLIMEDTFNLKIPNFMMGKEIGRGGMAKVFLGEQLQPKRKVAIKVVSPQGNDPKILDDLKKEGDTVAQFSHPNIVTVYSCGVIDHYYYLAMEILSGGDLTKKIKEGLSDLDSFNIMLDMAKALEHAHQRGTLHRDIKPENILFHEDGKAVLVDFGIAKVQNTVSEFTKVGAVVGTPHYMSPERALGKIIDERSDLYALGVVFYEMLIGKKVFEGDDTFAISYAHVHEPVPELPAEKKQYQALLNKLLAKSPDDRFQNATQLVSQLLKYIRRLKPRNETTHSFIPLSDHRVKTSAKPFILTGAAVSLIIVGFYWAMMRSPEVSINTAHLTPAQKAEMSDKLGAAGAHFNNENFQVAEDLYITVLTKYDCKEEDARARLKSINAVRYKQIIDKCDE
ncbi:MAG: serine/threonine protein kinase [Proteobacteria bacterium]|nr:serine/threonine protein kinase [Pseudomonadota bacterium]